MDAFRCGAMPLVAVHLTLEEAALLEGRLLFGTGAPGVSSSAVAAGLGRLLGRALRPLESPAAPVELRQHDVLQVLWPDRAQLWLDYCTLRDAADFALARATVARGEDADGRRGEFRVLRPGPGPRPVVLARRDG